MDAIGGSFDLINNAGSMIFSDGSGADRGFLERDSGQFEAPEEVFSACGASVLLRREMLDDIGLFDEDFFMYYEDTDLAWRARLRGWKFIYTPTSVMRHVHCGSSEEWSPFFTYHVERNRLCMLAKNANRRLFLRSWTGFYLNLGRDTGGVLRARLLGRQGSGGSSGYRSRLKAGRSLIARFPSLLIKRRQIQRRRKTDPAQVEQWMVPR